jgi:hypothetical protein
MATVTQNMPNLHNRYKSAERKISQKTPEYIYAKLLIAMSLQLKFELILGAQILTAAT